MGSKIELFRMTVYVFFPIAIFYYFNLPEFYEGYVSHEVKKMYPANNVELPKTREETAAFVKKLKEERMNKLKEKEDSKS